MSARVPDTVAQLAQAEAEEIENGTPAKSWPTLDYAAMYGPAGDFVEALAPHTEADDVALLVSTLAAFGSAIGRGPHMIADGAEHHSNLYVVVAGDTAKARKGTSWAQTRRLFHALDPEWADSRVVAGLSSGEGLIWQVRDEVTKEVTDKKGQRQTVVVVDPVHDKRLLVQEAEFAQVLKVTERQGNTLSPVVRSLWESGNAQALTKNSPARTTDAHVSVLGHITVAEAVRYLTETEAASGFANRFIWCCARRSKLLPLGGTFDRVNQTPILRAFREAIDHARRMGNTELEFDDDARKLWCERYAELSDAQPGLLGAVTARAEAQTIRLALIYALLDQERAVRAPHLEAALALWNYAVASARYIFSDALGDDVADEILAALRTGSELTRTQIFALFGNNMSAGRINRALSVLLAHNLAVSSRQPPSKQGGRPAEVWRALRTHE